MSVSRAELETMDRDELVDLIVELSDDIDDHKARFEALSKWKENTNERILEVVETNERLRAENQQLKDRLDEIEATAEQAMSVASRGHDPDARSKTEVAKHLTRNTLVTRAANNTAGTDLPLTIGDVQEKAEPEHDLKWQIVRNAWDDLKEEWPQFHETTSDGSQAMSIRQSHITKALARAVELDLGRTDLAKRFVGDETEEGREE